MNGTIDKILQTLEESGNLRTIPPVSGSGLIDLSSNDYLGLAKRDDLREEFFNSIPAAECRLSASASRLLAECQRPFTNFEKTLEESYGHGRKALIFNSGYHANVGMVSALGALDGAYILADKLVHASIIDGIRLSGAPFARFRHNDYAHLERLAEKAQKEYRNIIIIAESVYSMDGDHADIDALSEIKRRIPDAILYVDEAHAVGVEGPAGLGLAGKKADITVGTLGKALASVGAYAVLNPKMREFMVNKARSLIFSTAIPPVNVMWSDFIFRKSLGMDSERQHLRDLCHKLADVLKPFGFNGGPSHIQPLVTGDPHSAIGLSQKLKDRGFEALPIRVPTVPPGTDRIRFSLSASLDMHDIEGLAAALNSIMPTI